MTDDHGVHGPAWDYPEASLGRLIVDQARRTPHAPAVQQWDTTLTYRQLVGDAAALARTLIDLGVRPDDRVGICSRRTPAMVVAAVAVLFSGGCYVPLEAGGPRRRLLGIAEDAGLKIVVGDDHAEDFCAEFGATHVPVPSATPPVDPALVDPGPAGPDDLAYVLFTSGSTGRPKGVLNTHRNLVAFVTAFARLTDVGPSTRAVGFASLGFDLSTADIHVPLTVGGSVQLAGDDDRSDPIRLQRFLSHHRVNWGVIAPPVLAMLDPDTVPEYRTVLSGGEAIPPDLVERWTTPGSGRRFINVYGPTETSVAVTTAELSGPQTAPVPIGGPTPNHRGYVVDENGEPVAPGESGELLIGGPGVARGYLDRPGLTAQRFVPDPFSGVPGERLYRTGDIVRALPDGRFVYLGRTDGQLKVRGQRVEIGEIESVLRDHPEVREVVVVPFDGPTGTELAAYLAPLRAPARAELVRWAGDRLTSAMIPARVERLDQLPRNASEKLDRSLLASRAVERFGRAAAMSDAADPGPASSPVAVVTRVWERVLGIRPTDDDDFFDAGGNSISAMRLVATLRTDLRRDLTVEDVFLGRTPSRIADRATHAPEIDGDEITTGNPPTLSDPQRRLWFLDRLAPDAAPYNIAFAERLEGPLDLAALRAAVAAVADRHDVLRWRVVDDSGVPVAILDDAPASATAAASGDGEAGVIEMPDPAALPAALAEFAAQPLNLATGPSWRWRVYRIADDDHVVAFVLHHAVFDGWSQTVFYQDLASAYAAALSGDDATLPPAPAGYGDYAVWRTARDSRTGAADLAWWAEELADAPTVLDLPRDRPRPAVQTYRGEQVTVGLPAATDAAVRTLATRLGTTPTSVVLAAFGEMLRRLTGRDDHVIGAVVADRRVAAFDSLVGFFVDMLPVRLRGPGSADTFAARVTRSGAALMEATGHPGAPVERIVAAVGRSGRDTSRAPLVQVMFNVINYADPRLSLTGVTSTPIPVDKPGSPFDLTAYLIERDGRLGLELLYNPDLFDADRMQAFADDTVTLIAALCCEPESPIGSVIPDLPRPRVRDADPAAMTVEPAPRAPSDAAGTDSVGGGPMTPTERVVHEVWCEVLGRDAVGVTDNFFDVGGHSLALIEVYSRLSSRLPGLAIPMVDLFHHPNIRALAAHLDGASGGQELARAAARAASRRSRVNRRRAARTTRPNQERAHGNPSDT